MHRVEPVVDSGSLGTCVRAPQAWTSCCADRNDNNGSEACDHSGYPTLRLDALFPADIGWQCLQGLGNNAVTRSTAARRSRQEFVRGRQAAYVALRSVGFVDPTSCDRTNSQFELAELGSSTNLTESHLTRMIGKNADRSPRWPSGFVGSISHSRHWVMAAAARAKDYASIGIDSEPIATTDQADLLKLDIGRAAEWQLLDTMGLPLPTLFTLLFSAKEAFYKCWYPLTRRFLDFPDVIARRVTFEEKVSSDRITVGTVALALNDPDALELMVRFCITDQDIFTIATMGADHNCPALSSVLEGRPVTQCRHRQRDE